MRSFASGATRNNEENKPDYEGYLSPLVIEAYGRYMTKHRIQDDGTIRESDNWQKGIPLNAYMKSAWRHFMDLWKEHRGLTSREGLEDALCGLLFNIMGYLHEILKRKEPIEPYPGEFEMTCPGQPKMCFDEPCCFRVESCDTRSLYKAPRG
jgi:hypothetical protein